MNNLLPHEALMYAVYFAPRARNQLMNLGHEIAQRYLRPQDKLIGLIGEAGSGKSLFIRGMFPGLELVNDDQGVNIRPLPLLQAGERGFFGSHTYHVDIRFELAFTQMTELVQAVRTALELEKRVVVEHFELLEPWLGHNAEILIGIGEEVIVTRPTIFGPLPQDISQLVFQSARYRRMAHTAEDLTCKVIAEQYPAACSFTHADVRHGFVLAFTRRPAFDLPDLESRVRAYIAQDLPVIFDDENHIKIGDDRRPCQGPRIHVASTGAIENFQLIKTWQYHPIHRLYALVGLVGRFERLDINDLNKLSPSLL